MMLSDAFPDDASAALSFSLCFFSLVTKRHLVRSLTREHKRLTEVTIRKGGRRKRNAEFVDSRERALE